MWLGLGTLLNNIHSLGTYDTIDDLIKGISPEVNIAYNGKNAPTVSEAKDTVAEKKEKMKNPFWNWLLTFDSGKNFQKSHQRISR